MMRIAPVVVKELSRCPIPKAGKPGESRPLSLVHDAWAFINFIIHDDLSIAVEKAGLLDKDMIGYRPGMGAMDAMVPIICMLEECFVAGKMVGLLDEDEEKYFDRILHKLQEAVMRAVGIPDERYMEIKSEDMIDRVCTVLTNRGEVEIRFSVRLPQGQKLSVICCNLVSRAKLAQWDMSNPRFHVPWNKGFRFACRDKEDLARGREAILKKKNYSDDSTCITHNRNERSLAERMARNLSKAEIDSEEMQIECKEIIEY